MKRVLLLGGNGFLGRALTKHLSSQGIHVTSVSRKLPKDRLTGVNYVGSNYDNISMLSEELSEADTIVHLAWDSTPASSSSQPSIEVTTNLTPLARFIEATEKFFHGHLIFISSGGAVYGQPNHPPENAIVEQQLLAPLSYYGASKAAAEMMMQAFSSTTQTPVTILRPSNVYGRGQLPKRQFAVVPTLLLALKDEVVFDVVGNIESSRDYLYIDDFNALVSKCIAEAELATGFETFNVCAGQSTTLMELIQACEDVSGRKAKLRQLDARKEDPSIVKLSSVKTKKHFHWSSTTQLSDGLQHTWQWINSLSR